MPLRLTVLGTGYLGTTHAACMARLGYDVLGMDIDAATVTALSAGQLPLYEPELEDLLKEGLASGRLRFTTSYQEAAEFADLHFVCVGTPQKVGEYAADVSALDAVVDGLAPHLLAPAVVVGKSTVPIGTAARLAQRLRATAPAGDRVELAWNPEFLSEGFAVRDTLHPDRLVLGLDPARPGQAERRVREVYRPLTDAGVPMVVMDYPTAELVKVAANSFLATKISFINAMAEVCEATGADVTMLSTALSYDDRIGGKFLHAGLGFGGGCLPKDIRGFMARAGELGVDQALTFLREVDAINLRRRERMVDLAREVVGGSVAGVRFGVLGAAFKPGSDDVRDSPALDVAAALHRKGAVVVVHDPKAIENARRRHPELTYVESASEALRGADAVLLLTHWPEYVSLDPEASGTLVAERHILDGRNVLEPAAWRAAGWTYRALGRP